MELINDLFDFHIAEAKRVEKKQVLNDLNNGVKHVKKVIDRRVSKPADFFCAAYFQHSTIRQIMYGNKSP